MRRGLGHGQAIEDVQVSGRVLVIGGCADRGGCLTDGGGCLTGGCCLTFSDHGTTWLLLRSAAQQFSLLFESIHCCCSCWDRDAH